MPWKFGTASDIGGRSEQQDRLAVFHSRNGRRHLAVVADGMGGLQNGAQAAQILLDVASHHFAVYKRGDPYDLLDGICQTAHAAINELQTDDGSAPGTTAVLLFIDKQTAYWAHVGDSRLYHFRSGSLLNYTNDHSLLRLMLDRGVVEAGSAAAAEMQNRLYMHLGGETPPEPDFNASEVVDGDLFILCSDGFWQALRPSEIIASLIESPPDQDATQHLVDLARRRSSEGCDNISLVVSQWRRDQATGGWQRIIKMMRRFFSRHENRTSLRQPETEQ